MTERGFLGHPRGMPFLVGSESLNAFSFYGMQSLLVLYMTQSLLQPANVVHVAGFATFRLWVEALYGPLSTQALASAIQGLYAGGFFLMPIFGGLLADRGLGRTRTMILGAVLMTAGHFLMAFETTFLAALAFLLLGAGCFGANVSTQLGELYGPADLRRADAFQIFQMGVTVAVIFSPIVCGTLGQKIAWHWGFAAAGVGMLLGLFIYLAGLPAMPQQTKPARGPRHKPPRLTPGELLTVLVLLALLPALALTMLANQEIFNAYILWGNNTYNLHVMGQTMPVTWLVSLDASIGAGTGILVIIFWRVWDRRFGPLNEITRLAIGAVIMAGAPLVLALASWHAAQTGQKVGLSWALAFHLLNNIGFANLYPVGMALFSRAAPRALAGLMMGAFKLHIFLANLFVGYLGGLLGDMSGARFWLLHAGLVTTGAVLMLLFRAAFGRQLAPTVANVGEEVLVEE